MLRRYRDRDYVQTIEGYFFCVVGSVHPEDCVIAYLKYVPDPAGKWGRTSMRFKRALNHYTISDLLGTLGFLEDHPEYLFDSPVMGIRMSAVPVERVTAHFGPEEKLSELKVMEKPDTLQRKVVRLASFLSDESGVSIDYFGVTGSILLDIHQNFSDINLVIYGKSNSRLMKETLTQISEESRSPIRRLSEDKAREWCLDKAGKSPLTYKEARKIFDRKWGRGLFGRTMFSVHPVKLEEEVSETYGDRVFRPEGTIKIEATVSDASESDFLPSVYSIKGVTVLEGDEVEDIYEVTSYEGLFSGIAEKDERILAYGKLERVIDKRFGREYHRVLIGSKEMQGRDYIKLACLL